MTIFARSEDFEFEKVGAVVSTTDALYFDDAISRCALRGHQDNGSGWVAHNLGDFEDFWLSFRVRAQGTTPLVGRTPVVIYDTTNTARFRFVVVENSGRKWQGQYWNGSAWVDVGGAAYTYASDTTKTITLRLNQSANEMTVWSDNFGHTSGTIPMSGWSGIRRVDMLSWCDNTNHGFSEFIWGNEPILFHRYITRWPTANGDLTDGTGSYADVDEITLSDVDAIVLETSGHSKTFVKGTATFPTGDVRTVKVSSKVGNMPASGAQNVKARLRKGGVNYDQAANFEGFANSNPLYEAYWTQDPSTSANWGRADAASTALQFGLVAQP